MPHRLHTSEVLTALYPVESAPARRVRVAGRPVITCRERPVAFEPLLPPEQQHDDRGCWRALVHFLPIAGAFYVLVGIAAALMRSRGLI